MNDFDLNLVFVCRVPRRQGHALLPDCFLGKVNSNAQHSHQRHEVKQKVLDKIKPTNNDMRKSRNSKLE